MPQRLSFLGTSLDYAEAKVVVLGVPLERTSSWRTGQAQGPNAIRAASDSVEFFSAHFRKDVRNAKIGDLGDLDPYRSIEEILAEEEAEVTKILSDGKVPIVLGGEHTIVVPAVRAAAKFGPLQLLALDAHSDLREEYLGLRFCHATALRRAKERVENMVIVGARSFFGPDLSEPIFATPEEFATRLRPELPVWLSIDLDALDPSLCPGVTNPEPGGLSWAEVLAIFRTLQGFKVIGMDLVELAPPWDPSGVSAVCAAKLIIEAIAALWA
ncbi:MAG: agmatinase [Candidatus Bipolaricaulota bacterium]|nr:agmatinase [Candidatus Bipolaricaulota bacterium]MDW8126245.1 agmatinase [Candidatus Bipolaricaulota bacterium]